MKFRYIEPAPADAEPFEDIKIARLPDNVVKVWVGRAQKPTHHYRFNKPEGVEKFIAEQKQAAISRVAYKQQAKQQRVEARAKLADPQALVASAKHEQYFSTAETAALIRVQLAKKFPGIKFSVRSSEYAGGSSVSVSYEFGPSAKQVEELVGAFESRGFDGSIDLSYHKSSWLLPDGSAQLAHTPGTEDSRGSHGAVDTDAPHPGAVLVNFGASYVRVSRQLPESFYEQVGRDLCALQRVEYSGPYTRGLLGAGDTQDLQQHVNILLSKSSFPVGSQYAGVQYSDGDHWVAVRVEQLTAAKAA